MNRFFCQRLGDQFRVPRRRGDEPVIHSLRLAQSLRSPQARG